MSTVVPKRMKLLPSNTKDVKLLTNTRFNITATETVTAMEGVDGFVAESMTLNIGTIGPQDPQLDSQVVRPKEVEVMRGAKRVNTQGDLYNIQATETVTLFAGVENYTASGINVNVGMPACILQAQLQAAQAASNPNPSTASYKCQPVQDHIGGYNAQVHYESNIAHHQSQSYCQYPPPGPTLFPSAPASMGYHGQSGGSRSNVYPAGNVLGGRPNATEVFAESIRAHTPDHKGKHKAGN